MQSCNPWTPVRFPWSAEECFWGWRRFCFSIWPGVAREDRCRAGRSPQCGHRNLYRENTRGQRRRGCSMAGPPRRRKACSGRCSAGAGTRQCRKVFLFKDDAVMECMADDDESHSEDGDFLAAGGAAAEPGRVIEGADQSGAGAADGGEFLEENGKIGGKSGRKFFIIGPVEKMGRSVSAWGEAQKAGRKRTLR